MANHQNNLFGGQNGGNRSQFKPNKRDRNRNDRPEQRQPQGPVFEPGPGWGAKTKQWLDVYFWKLVFPIIAIIVLAVGLTNILEPETATEGGADDQKLEERMDENAGILEGDEIELEINEETGELTIPAHTRDEQNEIVVRSNEIRLSTQPGEGVTHLARKALREYLNRNADPQLTAEHKIFIEDYLKDIEGSRPLEVNETVSFSTIDIRSAIAQSKQLTDAQINNLSKYVPLAAGV